MVSTSNNGAVATTCPNGQKVKQTIAATRGTMGATMVATTPTKVTTTKVANQKASEKAAKTKVAKAKGATKAKTKVAKAANPAKAKVVEKVGIHNGPTRTRTEKKYAATFTSQDARQGITAHGPTNAQ